MRATEHLDYATRKTIPIPSVCKALFTHATQEELADFRKIYKKAQSKNLVRNIFLLFDTPETKKQWNAQLERKRQEVRLQDQLKGNQ